MEARSSSLQAALFQPGGAAASSLALAQNALAASSSLSSAAASVGGGGASPTPLASQALPMMPPAQSSRRPSPPYGSQPIAQHPPQLKQGYPEKKEYYPDDKRLTSGRVPATRCDGRKLFVGGLPNGVSDLSFLQFFQQYGEVIDSVVLLDRRTKRSRGFGFVTFADPNVAASLLTTIPGRTGMVNIMGKNCEVKASEPKTAEEAHLAHSTINLPPPHSSNSPHIQPPPPQGWNPPVGQQQQVVFDASKSLVPPNFNIHGGGSEAAASAGGGSRPIYSHSTITRTTPDPSSGSTPTVYIQNNFYTLPPGAEIPPSLGGAASTLTPEALVQAQQLELMQSGVAAALGQAAPYTTTYSSLQPLYPGSNGAEVNDTEGLLQQQRQIQQQQHHQANGLGQHLHYPSLRQH